MTKQKIDQIKEKVRKLLEDSLNKENEEPQSIGNPHKLFDNEEHEDEEGQPCSTKGKPSDRNQKSKRED